MLPFAEIIQNSLGIFKANLKDAHLKELLKGSTAAFILQIAGKIITYIFVLLVARGFGADAMGSLVIAITVLGIAQMFGQLGLGMTLLKFVAEYSSQKRQDTIKEVYLKALKLIVPLGIVLSFILFFTEAHIAKHIFHKEYLSFYFRIISLAILPAIFIPIHCDSLRGLKKIKESVFISNVAQPLFVSVLLGMTLFFTKKPYVPLIAYTAGVTIAFLLSTALWLKDSGIMGIVPSMNVKYKTLLSISLPMLFTSSLGFIIYHTDIVILGMLRPAKDVAVYAVAFKVSSLVAIIFIAVNSIAAPKFAACYGQNKINRLRIVAKQATKLIFWISLPVVLILLMWPSFFLGLFGQVFKRGSYALTTLVFGQLAYITFGLARFILQMTGKQTAVLKVMALAAILNVILNIILIGKYGINGAALASLVTIIFTNVVTFLLVRRYYGFYTFALDTIKLPAKFIRRVRK